MKERSVSAVIILAVLVISLLVGYRVFGLVMLIVAFLGFRELFFIKFEKRKDKLEIIRIISYIALMFIVLNNIFFNIKVEFVYILPILSLAIPIIMYKSDKYNIDDALFVLGIVFFLGFSIHNIIYMASIDVYKCIFIFLVAFVTDTYAYIGGLLIGRHHFTDISPNKTVEGCIIGSFMAVVVGSVYYHLAIGGLDIWLIVFITLVLTILSEIGDLVMSSIKRYYNKKDYSNLIPGHGGILDRFDSVIFVSLGFSLIMALL